MTVTKTTPRRYPPLAARIKNPSPRTSFGPLHQLPGELRLSGHDFTSGRYRLQLYRFLTDRIPAIAACIWTWARLTAAPGRFMVTAESGTTREKAEQVLADLSCRIYASPFGPRLGLDRLLADLTPGLFRDGMIGGFVTVLPDRSGIDQFVPLDPINCQYDATGRTPKLRYETGETTLIDLDRPDFYSLGLSDSLSHPLGRSILHAIPFVAYIEQQLVNDMQRASHNAGYHRLHVKITPPERISGESDQAYTERINSYFDATMDMIRACETDDNPVTWDNVEIDYIGPDKSREVANSWFMTHRAMIEEICAGTSLAPFLLGYSYGATTTWADFKFDIVMRQVATIQRQLADLLEWLGTIELALRGLDGRCEFVFDNTLSYQIADRVTVDSTRVNNLLRLFEAGLIDKTTAAERAGRLI